MDKLHQILEVYAEAHSRWSAYKPLRTGVKSVQVYFTYDHHTVVDTTRLQETRRVSQQLDVHSTVSEIFDYQVRSRYYLLFLFVRQRDSLLLLHSLISCDRVGSNWSITKAGNINNYNEV